MLAMDGVRGSCPSRGMSWLCLAFLGPLLPPLLLLLRSAAALLSCCGICCVLPCGLSSALGWLLSLTSLGSLSFLMCFVSCSTCSTLWDASISSLLQPKQTNKKKRRNTNQINHEMSLLFSLTQTACTHSLDPLLSNSRFVLPWAWKATKNTLQPQTPQRQTTSKANVEMPWQD